MEASSIQVIVDVPAKLADKETPALARTLLVLEAIRSERISWRTAADELGLSPEELLDLAREHGVPVVRYGTSEWQQDSATLERLLKHGSDRQ